MTEKYIELLNRQLNELNSIGKNPSTAREYSFGVEAWKSSTISILERIFGKESRKLSEIEKIKLKKVTGISGPDKYYIETVKETGTSILNACIAELETVCSPEQIYHGSTSSFNLTVSQKNNQTVTLDIIIKEIQRELTGNQAEELQKIIDSDGSLAEKKEKASDKLKQFGINTLSSIISGIITNPAIYGGG